MNKEILDKINRFTRRPLAENELYTFSVILCDNDIDRDIECFSDKALDMLKDGFVGKTGVFDHNASTLNQNARIYDTELISDDSRLTKDGRPYKYLKGYAYMVRTDDNKNLIAEIDGGIKKEVSISCSASKRLCSVCGCDRNTTGCAHSKGKLYGNSLCHTVLDDITDTYEWSFVAVPSQVNAGVTKHFSETEKLSYIPSAVSDNDESIRREIRRLAFFAGGTAAAETASVSAKSMNTAQLVKFRNSFEKYCTGGLKLQLDTKSEETENYEEFSMK